MEYEEDFDYNTDGSDEDEDGLALSDDDDGIAMDQGESERAAPSGDTENMEATVMSRDDLEREMLETITDMVNFLRIRPGMCRILLKKFNWNKESVLERYYENQDSTENFLKACQVIPKNSAPIPMCSTGDCMVCCGKAPLSGLQCHHWVCSECWETYITTKILMDSTSDIQCISNGCELLVEDEKIISYIEKSSKNVLNTYSRLKINSFVDSHRLIKWCPGVDCGKALKVTQPDPRPVLCSCGMKFCFGCSQEWHEPVNCRLLKLWLKKCSDDSETSNWINANTKECPKCQVTIEKDGGCNHMTCKNTACRAEFCWMCLGAWEPHGSAWYNCNRFDDSNAKKARDAQERSRAALQRYLHYYNRFMNHQQSLKLENKLYATVKSKMEHMQQHANGPSMSWIEVQFLKKAVDVLSECRRTLMYTYAFAYYLEGDNNSIIFEDNQKDLEFATEQLSMTLERDLDDQNFTTLKQNIQDKYRYVDQRRIVLLHHCHEGTNNDTWKFTQ